MRLRALRPQLKRDPLDGATIGPLFAETLVRRYAAKLLFQWNPEPNEPPRRIRLCEERIVTFGARSPRAALARAKAIGRRAQLRLDMEKGPSYLQFVGILQLMQLGLEAEEHEVWWELSYKLLPRERRSRILPRERDLRVFTDFDTGPAPSPPTAKHTRQRRRRRLTSA